MTNVGGGIVLNQATLDQLQLGALTLGDADLATNQTHRIAVEKRPILQAPLGAVEFNALAGNGSAITPESGVVFS